MPYLIIRHKVEDYDRWKPVFDEDAGNRRAHGSRGGQLFHNANDASEVVALWDFPTLEQAQQFTQSPALHERMRRAGVADQPDIYFLEEVERPEA